MRLLRRRGVIAEGSGVVYGAGTGGTVTEPGDGFRYHTFTASGTFTVTASGVFDVLVVSGGGAGGYNLGGGGGAGGAVPTLEHPLPTGGVTATVGAGGAQTTSYTANPGASSSFDTITVVGGAGGPGSGGGAEVGNNGACGSGGASANGAAGGTGSIGGNGGAAGPGGAPYEGGGGGGMGGNGTAGGVRGAGVGGTGGAGIDLSAWQLGTICGGGGGACDSTETDSIGGTANAGYCTGHQDWGTAATANSGSGGGGGGRDGARGGAGGSGVIVVRYPI